MTRKTAGTPAGKVVFVGAGPGDPGMLTVRASEAVAAATVVLVDPDVSAGVQDVVRETASRAELTPVTGPPAEADRLGRDLAAELLDRGAAELMAASR